MELSSSVCCRLSKNRSSRCKEALASRKKSEPRYLGCYHRKCKSHGLFGARLYVRQHFSRSARDQQARADTPNRLGICTCCGWCWRTSANTQPRSVCCAAFSASTFALELRFAEVKVDHNLSRMRTLEPAGRRVRAHRRFSKRLLPAHEPPAEVGFPSLP
jgi:hypothetical protein